MYKPIWVLTIYLAFLFVFSLLLSRLNSLVFYIPLGGNKIEVNVIMLLTILGGIICLKLTVSPGALKIFLIIYACLWIIRYVVLLVALHVKEVSLFGKVFHLYLIIPSYYSNVSRLGTPLPFIIFWFINNLFSTGNLSNPKK